MRVDASCYDADTRLLSVPIGSLLGGDEYVLTFDVLINQVAIQPGDPSDRDLSNTCLLYTSENQPGRLLHGGQRRKAVAEAGVVFSL